MYNKAFSIVVFVCFFSLMAANLSAQDKYPDKPIQALVGYAPGGATDSASRIMAEFLQKQLKQPVVVVNKPGGGGAIVGNELFKSKPDGYTIGMFNDNQPTPEYMMNPERFIYKSKDILAIAQWTGTTPTFFTRYDAPWKTTDDFVKYARSNPNKLKWSHAGVGNFNWMVGTKFIQQAGVKMLDVPFQGDAESITALLGSHVDLSVIAYGTLTIAQMEAKKIRPLCMSTQERFDLLPEVPTCKELGYDIGLPLSYLGTFVPRPTPKEVFDKLGDAILKVTKEPEFRERLAKIGMPVWYRNARDLEEYIENAAKLRYKVLKELGVL